MKRLAIIALLLFLIIGIVIYLRREREAKEAAKLEQMWNAADRDDHAQPAP